MRKCKVLSSFLTSPLMDILQHASGANAEPSDGSCVNGLGDDPYFAGIYEPFHDEKFLQVSALTKRVEVETTILRMQPPRTFQSIRH